MAKLEERAVDAGIVELKGKDDAALVDWWKERLTRTADVPGEIARAGALLPQLRQLSRSPEAERRQLTKARMLAFVSLAADQRQRVIAARKLAMASDPDLLRSDDAVVQQLVPEVPGAQQISSEMGQ